MRAFGRTVKASHLGSSFWAVPEEFMDQICASQWNVDFGSPTDDRTSDGDDLADGAYIPLIGPSSAKESRPYRLRVAATSLNGKLEFCVSGPDWKRFIREQRVVVGMDLKMQSQPGGGLQVLLTASPNGAAVPVLDSPALAEEALTHGNMRVQSCSSPVLAAEAKALENLQKTLSNPSFSVLNKQATLNCFLKIPRKYCRLYFPASDCMMTILVGDTADQIRKWPVKWSAKRQSLSKGWRRLITHQASVKQGDFFVMEVMGENTLQVHIVRMH